MRAPRPIRQPVVKNAFRPAVRLGLGEARPDTKFRSPAQRKSARKRANGGAKVLPYTLVHGRNG